MQLKKAGCFVLSVLMCLPYGIASGQTANANHHPNILFIIMDDVGIDQLRSFGYGGLTPPHTPVLDAVAQSGIRFRNVWAMPECSPSRAMFFEGRYPLRTNIYTAILSTDLANSQVSPYEVTTPKILHEANYTSAMFGKFHLAGPDNNPFAYGTPNSLGFDYFHGFLEGAPYPIDTTAGGVSITGSTGALSTGPYSCGFVPNTQTDPVNGANSGACYFADKRGCKLMSQTPEISTPGRACLEEGGIFEPNATSCQSTPPANLNFNLTNAYYVWKLVENDLATNTVKQFPTTDPRARTYSPVELTTAAIDWINKQGNKPWMATVSYSSIHAPYQQAPQKLTPATGDLSGVSCTGSQITDTRALSDQMIEAMDTEIGRLLVKTGLASRNASGAFEIDPAHSNTMIVIIGDNGTYAPSVKAPFDLTHAKGYVYQTGVWVPLIVAGPLVNSPNRNVESMVNVADLFQLFGEIAGLDVRKYVPPAREIDSVSMLPYLLNPAQPSLRQYNFTQGGINISAQPRPGPCMIRIPQQQPNLVNTCVQLFPNQAICQQEGGKWYGPVNGQGGYDSCCALLASGTVGTFDILPVSQAAVRNDSFKLIQLTNENCQGGTQNGTTNEYQLYRVNQAVPIPKIDYVSTNLIQDPNNPTNGLTPEETTAFVDLKNELNNILNSEPACPGDGNSDGIVDSQDVQNWSFFNGKGSSWYDFPTFNPSLNAYAYDGQTGTDDLAVIQNNLGVTCKPR